jgi:hypothetical protein
MAAVTCTAKDVVDLANDVQTWAIAFNAFALSEKDLFPPLDEALAVAKQSKRGRVLEEDPTIDAPWSSNGEFTQRDRHKLVLRERAYHERTIRFWQAASGPGTVEDLVRGRETASSTTTCVSFVAREKTGYPENALQLACGVSSIQEAPAHAVTPGARHASGSHVGLEATADLSLVNPGQDSVCHGHDASQPQVSSDAGLSAQSRGPSLSALHRRHLPQNGAIILQQGAKKDVSVSPINRLLSLSRPGDGTQPIDEGAPSRQGLTGSAANGTSSTAQHALPASPAAPRLAQLYQVLSPVKQASGHLPGTYTLNHPAQTRNFDRQVPSPMQQAPATPTQNAATQDLSLISSSHLEPPHCSLSRPRQELPSFKALQQKTLLATASPTALSAQTAPTVHQFTDRPSIAVGTGTYRGRTASCTWSPPLNSGALSIPRGAWQQQQQQFPQKVENHGQGQEVIACTARQEILAPSQAQQRQLPRQARHLGHESLGWQSVRMAPLSPVQLQPEFSMHRDALHHATRRFAACSDAAVQVDAQDTASSLLDTPAAAGVDFPVRPGDPLHCAAVEVAHSPCNGPSAPGKVAAVEGSGDSGERTSSFRQGKGSEECSAAIVHALVTCPPHGLTDAQHSPGGPCSGTLPLVGSTSCNAGSPLPAGQPQLTTTSAQNGVAIPFWRAVLCPKPYATAAQNDCLGSASGATASTGPSQAPLECGQLGPEMRPVANACAEMRQQDTCTHIILPAGASIRVTSGVQGTLVSTTISNAAVAGLSMELPPTVPLSSAIAAFQSADGARAPLQPLMPSTSQAMCHPAVVQQWQNGLTAHASGATAPYGAAVSAVGRGVHDHLSRCGALHCDVVSGAGSGVRLVSALPTPKISLLSGEHDAQVLPSQAALASDVTAQATAAEVAVCHQPEAPGHHASQQAGQTACKDEAQPRGHAASHLEYVGAVTRYDMFTQTPARRPSRKRKEVPEITPAKAPSPRPQKPLHAHMFSPMQAYTSGHTDALDAAAPRKQQRLSQRAHNPSHAVGRGDSSPANHDQEYCEGAGRPDLQSVAATFARAHAGDSSKCTPAKSFSSDEGSGKCSDLDSREPLLPQSAARLHTQRAHGAARRVRWNPLNAALNAPSPAALQKSPCWRLLRLLSDPMSSAARASSIIDRSPSYGQHHGHAPTGALGTCLTHEQQHLQVRSSAAHVTPARHQVRGSSLAGGSIPGGAAHLAASRTDYLLDVRRVGPGLGPQALKSEAHTGSLAGGQGQDRQWNCQCGTWGPVEHFPGWGTQEELWGEHPGSSESLQGAMRACVGGIPENRRMHGSGVTSRAPGACPP